jgi:hypothetical protein
MLPESPVAAEAGAASNAWIEPTVTVRNDPKSVKTSTFEIFSVKNLIRLFINKA